jgi:hypothetical protein
LVLFVVLDDFLNDEVQEFLGELRIEIGLTGQILKTRNLFLFPRRIGGGKIVFGFENTHALGVFEPLGQGEKQDGSQPVNAFPVTFQKGCGAGCCVGGVSQWPILSA